MTTTHDGVPLPAGATEISEWADVGHPDEFRSFTGPTWTIPGLQYSNGDDAAVLIYGTQLADGTVEERCIRLGGVHWDDELTSQTARDLSAALAAAADDLDRLTGCAAMTAALDRRCELCGAEPGTACVNPLRPNEPITRACHLVRKVDQLPTIDVGSPTHLRQVAAAIAELNSMQGLPSERASVSPNYLIAAADAIDGVD